MIGEQRKVVGERGIRDATLQENAGNLRGAGLILVNRFSAPLS
jgi:hypothetical protein